MIRNALILLTLVIGAAIFATGLFVWALVAHDLAVNHHHLVLRYI